MITIVPIAAKRLLTQPDYHAGMREDQAYAMQQAIESGDETALRRLLLTEPRLTGTPIPVPRDWGEEMWLGLHLASFKGEALLVEALLQAGASIDSRTRFRTPMHGRASALMLASRSGHLQVVQLLLKHHADGCLLDANHRCALSHAAEAGHGSIVGCLLGSGVPVDPVDDQGRTPLHWAIASGHEAVALALIEAGALVNQLCPKEPAGYTPLHRCVSAGPSMDRVAERLKQVGADQTLRDPRFGRSAAELTSDRID